MDTIGIKVSKNPPQKYLMASQICLRILAAATALAAACIMLTNKQSILLFGTIADARYNYCSAFKFFVVANLIACAFSVVSFLDSIRRKTSNSMNYFHLFLHDLVIMTLLMAANAAATAIGYVGKYGYNHAGWMPICDNFTSFCNRVYVCLSLSYLSFFCYLFLTIISANNIASQILD